MKFLVVLTIALVLSGAQAGFIDSVKSTFNNLKTTFSNLFKSVVPIVSQSANKILGELKSTAGSLLVKGLGALTSVGKSTRDVAALENIGKFLSKGNDLIGNLSNLVGSVFSGALNKITDLVSKIKNVDLLGNSVTSILKSITSGVDDAVSEHTIQQGTILKLLQNPGEFLGEAAKHLFGLFKHNKRDLSTTLSAIGQSITDTFKPFINTLGQHIHTIGSAVKNVGSTLLTAVKPTVDALKTKLSGHIATLKNVGQTLLGHGKNAISALTDAFTDILSQTFKNAQPHIQKAIETAKDAGSITVNHLIGTLTGKN